MALDTMLTISPAGIASICSEWFDEECPAEAAYRAATMPSTRPTNPGGRTSELTLVWIKSRLREQNVFRGLAPELSVKDGTPMFPPSVEAAISEGEELGAAVVEWYRSQPIYPRSRIAASPLVIRPINRVADRVAHFDDHRGCPYCRKWYRNGAALRLHVIDAHLSEIS